MYDYGAVGVMYSSLHIAVMASARYCLYNDRLRVPPKLMYAILATLALTSGTIWLLTGGVPGMTFDAYRMVTASFMFALSCLIIKAPLAEHAFSYAFLFAGDAAIETTAFYIQTNFVPSNSAYAYPVISILIMAAILVPGFKSLKRMITRISALESDRVWGWLDLACFSFLFMGLLTTLPHPDTMSLLYPASRYLMLLGMVGIYNAAIRIMDAMRGAVDARAELMLTQRRIAMQQAYYDRIISQMDDVRRMRHDLRHYRSALAALVKSGDTAALSEYMDAPAAAEEPVPVTGNLTADSMLFYYMDVAKELSVRVETRVAMAPKTPVSDPDLCVILGNLLENAMDAQKYLEPSRRYIRVTASGDGSCLTIAVDNRFDGTLKLENGVYISRKDGEGHGIGLSSVKAICEKYDGILQFETDGDLFMVGIVIGL